MAQLNLDFYDNVNIYDDGNVENELLEHYKNNKTLDFNRDDIFYLTTNIRTNILNWYPFSKNDEVLEIGCGCGTITEMLCNKCKFVTSVEGSKRRAEITYYRHKDKENLAVYAGNFEKFKINKKFDYIILIGVFEYAKMFFHDKSPFDFFLKKIKELLKENGKVLIAIENRYGIKYWAGANEDHLRVPYVGLESYDNYDVQTFGKNEFISLIQKNGFKNYKFYYPFPDYKLPSVVYTDERLPKYDEIFNIPIFTYGNPVNFNIHKVLAGLVENNEFGFFSNSFLVEFSKKDIPMSDIIFAKNTINRNIEYQITTVQNSKQKYFKFSDYAGDHLNKMYELHNKMSKEGILNSKVIKRDNYYEIDNVKGKNVAEFFKELVLEKDKEGILKEFDKLVEFYKTISDYKKLENPILNEIKSLYKKDTYILKFGIIDGNVSNIIRNKDGKYVLIDQEWISKYEIPTDYLVMHSILYIYGINGEISEFYDIEEIFKRYNISLKKRKKLLEIEDYYYHVENQVLNQKNCDIISNCSQRKVVNQLVDYNVIYYDTGDGFCEENKIIGTYNLEKNLYSVKFTLPKNAKIIRFDPSILGGRFLEFSELKVNNKTIKYDKYNIESYNNKNLLIQEHPFVTFICDSKEINISLKINEVSQEEVCGIINNFTSIRYENEQLKNKLQENIDTEKELNETKELLNLITNSKGWKILEKIRKICRKK